MNTRQKGEIATILTLGALIIIGISTLIGSIFLKSSKNKIARNSKADTCRQWDDQLSGFVDVECGPPAENNPPPADQQVPPEEQQSPLEAQPQPANDVFTEAPPPPPKSAYQTCLEQNTPSECRGMEEGVQNEQNPLQGVFDWFGNIGNNIPFLQSPSPTLPPPSPEPAPEIAAPPAWYDSSNLFRGSPTDFVANRAQELWGNVVARPTLIPPEPGVLNTNLAPPPPAAQQDWLQIFQKNLQNAGDFVGDTTGLRQKPVLYLPLLLIEHQNYGVELVHQKFHP